MYEIMQPLYFCSIFRKKSQKLHFPHYVLFLAILMSAMLDTFLKTKNPNGYLWLSLVKFVSVVSGKNFCKDYKKLQKIVKF